jgi:hypothetical protein
MGISLVWFAVEAAAARVFLDRAGFEDTGEPDDYFEADTSGGLMPSGWYVLATSDFDLIGADILADWSRGAGRLIAAIADEESQSCMATEWVAGEEVWSISYLSDRADSLTVSGKLPAAFDAIYDRLLNPGGDAAGEGAAAGSAVDHPFEAPVALAEAITGFRHDGVYEGVFSALAEI